MNGVLFTFEDNTALIALQMPEEFENKGYTLKTQQMFAVHTTLEKFTNLPFQSLVMLDL